MNFRDPQVQKKAMLVMLPLALAVAYQQLVYTPRAAELEQLEIRLETLNAQNNALRAVVARYGTDLERRLAIFQEHLGQLEQLIPNREDVPHLLNQITESAGSSGVELVEVRPGGETPGQFYSKQTYELQVAGDYHSVAEYLTTIGSLPRIVRTADVSLQRTDGRSSDRGGALLRVRFRIDTYVMPVPGETPPAPAEG
jgi:type IV pilus assembly protein PilO